MDKWNDANSSRIVIFMLYNYRKLIFSGLVLALFVLLPVGLSINLNTVSNSTTNYSQDETYKTSVSLNTQKTYAVSLKDRITPPYNPSEKTLITTWSFIRSLVNSFLVVMLLLAAFSNILHINIDTYAVKKVLPMMILGVILANFSLFICRMFVDVSNVLSYSFIGAAGGQDISVAITENILKAVGFSNVELSTTGAISFIENNATWAAAGQAIGLLLAVILMFLPLVIIIFLILVMMWIRNGMMMMLIVFSPLAFFALAFPFTSQWFKKWWSLWLVWCFMPPVLLIFIRIGAEISTANTGGGASFFAWVLGIAMLIIGIIAPFKIGGMIGKAVGGLGILSAKAAGRETKIRAQAAATGAADKQAGLKKDLEAFNAEQEEKKGLLAKQSSGEELDEKEEARLEELENSKTKRPSRLAMAKAKMGFGGLMMGATDIKRRQAAREERALGGIKKAGEERDNEEAQARLNKEAERAKSEGELKRIKELEDKELRNEDEETELTQLQSDSAKQARKKASKIKGMSKTERRALQKQVMIFTYEEAKYATAEGAIDYFKKNRQAVENYASGQGHKNTAKQNLELMKYTEEMRTDLNKTSSSGDYQSGAKKAHAFGIAHTSEMAALGITRDDLDPSIEGSSEVFRKKAMNLSIRDRRILGTQVAESAKAFHTMTDRPFKAPGEVTKFEPEPETDITIHRKPGGEISISSSKDDSQEQVDDLQRVETELRGRAEHEIQKIQSDIRTQLREGGHGDVVLDIGSTVFTAKMDMKTKNSHADNQSVIQSHIDDINAGRRMNPEQVKERKTELRKLDPTRTDKEIDATIETEQQDLELSESQTTMIRKRLQTAAPIMRELHRHAEGAKTSREKIESAEVELDAQETIAESFGDSAKYVTEEDIRKTTTRSRRDIEDILGDLQ